VTDSENYRSGAEDVADASLANPPPLPLFHPPPLGMVLVNLRLVAVQCVFHLHVCLCRSGSHRYYPLKVVYFHLIS